MDLEGKTLLPGFVDAHTHPSSSLFPIDISLNHSNRLSKDCLQGYTLSPIQNHGYN
ncbi:MAG: hypothetical protein ACE5HX_15735 [bacterium]